MATEVLALIEMCARKLHENCPHCEGSGMTYDGEAHLPCPGYEHAREAADIVVTELQTEYVVRRLMPAQQDTNEQTMAEALAPFGWTCGPEFWERYYSDPWVFNLANAVERLSRERRSG